MNRTPLKGLIQVLAMIDVHDVNQIAAYAGVTPRAVNKAKKEMRGNLSYTMGTGVLEKELEFLKENLSSPLACAPTRANSNPFGVSSYEDNKIKKTNTKKAGPKVKTMVRDDWKPEPAALSQLCEKFLMSEDQVLTFIEDEYKPACRAKGYKYVDHTAAVRNWLGKRKSNPCKSSDEEKRRLIEEEKAYVRSLNLC